MTVQEAKNELKGLRKEKIFIEHKEQELAIFTNKLDRIVESEQKIACFAELQNLYEEYAKELVKAYRHKLSVEKRIDKMPHLFRTVLTMLYLKGKTMTAAALAMNYNYAYLSRIKMLALAYYAEKYSNENNPTVTEAVL